VINQDDQEHVSMGDQKWETLCIDLISRVVGVQALLAYIWSGEDDGDETTTSMAVRLIRTVTDV
jgi:hypothetical protein